jgi:cellobiose transport system permease protein
MFRYSGRTLVREVVMLIVALVILLPLYILFNTAFKTTDQVFNTSSLAPALDPTLDGFKQTMAAEGNRNVLIGVLNSFIITAGSVILLVAFGSIGAYTLARRVGRVSRLALVLVVVAIALPVQLGIIPRYMLMTELGWVNSLRAVIVPDLVTAFGVFWMRQYIQGAVPDELLDAARVDGCSNLRIYRHVILPAVRPAAAMLALFTFMQAWNEFIWPLVVLTSREQATLQVALQQLNDNYYQDYAAVMTGTLLAVLPVLALFVVLGKQLMGGLLAGAVKG